MKKYIRYKVYLKFYGEKSNQMHQNFTQTNIIITVFRKNQILQFIFTEFEILCCPLKAFLLLSRMYNVSCKAAGSL